MDYRKLGRTGLKVSELSLGTMQFGWTANESLSHKVLSAAFEAGINCIDTADIYSRWVDGNPGGVSERIIGKWMKKNQIHRDQVVIATKVRGQMGEGPNDQGLSRAHILNAVEDSLRRLDTDYIDLYQVHWYDEETPIDETLSVLDDLVRQGKVRYIETWGVRTTPYKGHIIRYSGAPVPLCTISAPAFFVTARNPRRAAIITQPRGFASPFLGAVLAEQFDDFGVAFILGIPQRVPPAPVSCIDIHSCGNLRQKIKGGQNSVTG